jgi:hypothetical protein
VICVDLPRQVCSGFPVRAAEMQWAKWLAFQSKTSPVRQSGSGGAGLEWGMSGLHSQWDDITRGRHMLFVSGEITAALMFQRP